MSGWQSICRALVQVLLFIVSVIGVIPMTEIHANGGIENSTLSDDYQELEWTDLLPDADLQALLNPPDFLNDIEDGSADDVLDSRLQSEFNGLGDSAFSQALTSTDVVPDYDGKAIRLPGFIVPLAYNSDRGSH